MKKKLVAVAVAGVLGAPLAAHAQTANVTLYGRLNTNYELVNGRQADGSNPNVSRISSNSSRLGATNAETRRVRAQAAHRRIRAVGLTTVDELEVDVKPAVQRHVRSLRIRSQRSGENARNGDSNELLFH